MNWFELTKDQVKEIIKAAQKKNPVASLEEFSAELEKDVTNDFSNVVGQDSLTRFDKPKKASHKKRRNNKKRRRKKPRNNA